MANNLLNILDKILARGLPTLREAAVMPRLTNGDYGAEAAMKGSTIDVPVPRAQVVRDVAPSNIPVSAASNTPGLVQIQLNDWKSTDFFLTDKEMVEIDRNRHFLPMQTAEAMRAMANDIDTAIHREYKGIYGFVGTAGVTPFSTAATAPRAREVLNKQLTPQDGQWRIVMDPSAEAQALTLPAYADVSQTTDARVKIEGEIGRKYGFDHFMSQNVQTHVAGTVTSMQVITSAVAGASTVTLGGTSTLGTLVIGDVFTIAGDSQTYVSKSSVTITSAGVPVAISPPLKQDAAQNAVVTKKATHVVNLAFHRNAFAWATRPLMEAVSGDVQQHIARSMTDPVSGITVRLEVSRQHKQTVWELDFLRGQKLVREQFAARIAG